MNGVKIEYTASYRFLGVIIDDKVKFNDHINQLAGKISKSCGILYKLRPYVNQKTLVTVYRSLVECHLNYCILVFGNTYTLFTEAS